MSSNEISVNHNQICGNEEGAHRVVDGQSGRCLSNSTTSKMFAFKHGFPDIPANFMHFCLSTAKRGARLDPTFSDNSLRPRGRNREP
jgi:hypothetical protein